MSILNVWHWTERARPPAWRAAAVLLLLASPIPAAAQSEISAGQFIGDVLRDVATDPTTYAPAGVSYAATRLDWNSSQPLLTHGYLEHNPRYTASGVPDQPAISYGAGNRLILNDTLKNLGTSALHNAAEQAFEHALIGRHPGHAKLIRFIGWTERLTFASLFAYQLSDEHVRQWRTNRRLVIRLGF